MEKANISEKIRIIQHSTLSPSKKQSEIAKLFDEYIKFNSSDILFSDFIQTISKVVSDSINTIKNFVPVEFKLCSKDNAKKFASHIGIHIIEVHSKMYLSWAVPLNK